MGLIQTVLVVRDTIPTYIYNAGTDGDGSGTCGNLTWDEDYNIVKGFKSNNAKCVGTHDQCGVDPIFTGSVPIGHGSQSAYYNGAVGYSLVGIQLSSPARSAASSTQSYWNNSNDYNNQPRPPWDIGSEIYGSCVVNGNICTLNTDCCGGSCTNFICGGSGGGGSSTGDSFTNIKMSLITFK